MNAHHTNLARIRAVSRLLGPLSGDVVFVGGATVSLYATAPAAEEVRPTDDVDIVVELATYGAYAALEARLRSLGFVNDQESGIICRYKIHGLTVDVMPTDGSFLGSNNQWYQEGFENSMAHSVDAETTVRIFSPPYFLASKLDAFKDRGGSDGRSSTDFEDITYVLNNRDEIWGECAVAPENVKAFLKDSFNTLLANESIEEWLSCHLEYGFAEEQAQRILKNVKIFVEGNQDQAT